MHAVVPEPAPGETQGNGFFEGWVALRRVGNARRLVLPTFIIGGWQSLQRPWRLRVASREVEPGGGFDPSR